MKDKREKRKNRMKALRQAVNMELKEHRSTFIVFFCTEDSCNCVYGASDFSAQL